MTHPQNDPQSTDDELRDATRAVVGIGAAWARYGLTMGRAAVETSARSLEATARLLGALADAVDRRRGAPPANAAPHEPESVIDVPAT
ncbi:MAG: hypothetical protein IT376_13185 [Polyangiaceae bacterium]|nr:hypothetical protein [Polyangiaceae bacterium]